MSSSLPSEEIASAFKDALQDLQMNVRWEINNLTMIAKENIEHAMAISRTLEQHIRTTTPERKLPALYVLDSIVKNVGTPYTLYLGRNLYSTFMDSYTLVDGQTRRAMDSMLKTWKEPVPGSMEAKPVFPVEITRTIENALIKARTVFVQQNQNLVRNQSHPQQQAGNRQFHALPPRPAVAANGGPMMRETRSPSLPPPNQVVGWVANVGRLPNANEHLDQPSQQPTAYAVPAPTNTVGNAYISQQVAPDRLSQDLDELIRATQTQITTRPHDHNVQKRLKALLDLQQVLATSRLPPDQLMLVKNQIDQLTIASRRSPAPEYGQNHVSFPPQLSASFSPSQGPSHLGQNGNYRPPSATPQFQPGGPPQSPSMDLASILASANSSSNPPPSANSQPFPNLAALLGQPQLTENSNNSAPQSNSLLDSLRTAGLLPSTNPPSRPTSTSNLQGAFSVPNLRNMVATPPIPVASAGRTPLSEIKNEIKLNTASLRTSRPQLVGSLFSALRSQCSTCGRRFPATPDGRETKARHLDAHFRTNRKLADAAARTGSSRSWFSSELEWIRYRESSDGDESGGADGKDGKVGENLGAVGSKPEPKVKFIKAPTDATVASHTCPICQDKFETVWHDGAQEWVWMDAEVVGGRVYHASCRAEIMGDAGKSSISSLHQSGASISNASQASGRGSATPDSVLGKRKAESSLVADGESSLTADAGAKTKRRAAAT